ncbi:MAG: SAM-dependent methyltransferase [Leptolyngbyaceae cyanobacterium CSU_1_3]|nr:SAM-dependent methyltransferase [Leptolyngbyaceae cyanobacterium CSU_1_3]
MAMELDRVVPFGRSLDEYVQMFNLTERDLQRSILGVGDGPASFNAEGTKLGYQIQSIDPLYEFSAAQIRSRFEAVVCNIIEQVRRTPNDWVWGYHGSPDGLKLNRERAIELFCQDYELGKATGRYTIAALPELTLDRTYDLGLCSHLLFLYSDHLDEAFHFAGICAMLRVCREVRIFPLLTLNLQPSPYLSILLKRFSKMGYTCEIQKVAYELQRGGNKMLKITQP